MAWALINYMDQKDNVDAIVAAEVEDAKKAQAEEDEKSFVEREKEPFRTYSGPSDLGSVTFSYPKTWSVYEESRDDELTLYLHPLVVPSVDSGDPVMAAKVEVLNERYDEVLTDYEGEAEDGALKVKPYETNDYKGIRFTGQLEDDRTGTVVIFKVRDKTLVITTNAPNFIKDLDNSILKTLKFNP